MNSIMLFDLDGVLLAPKGYGTALVETFHHFYSQMGLDDFAPGEIAGETFESYAVTNDWDMLAIGLAITFDHLLKVTPGLCPPETLDDACKWVWETKLRLPAGYNFTEEIQKLGPYYWNKQIPSESILDAALHDRENMILPELKKHALMFDLLGTTRQIIECKPIRYFQNLILGDIEFEKVYGVRADFKTESYLLRYDRLALSPQIHDRLIQALQEDHVRAAAITARPSRPPKEIIEEKAGYSPEAEFAVEILGLPNLPIIGCGRLQYLGELLNKSDGFDAFVKPAGTHALAGIGAAWCKSELAGLRFAGAHYQESCGNAKEKFLTYDGLTWDHFPRQLKIQVFEDSPGGLRSAKQACDWMILNGVQTQLKMYGVAVNPDKVAALENEGALVYADVNEAVFSALND